MPELPINPQTVTTYERPITKDSLPTGLWFEADGAGWKAMPNDYDPKGWSWVPRNNKARGKDRPYGEMSETCPWVWDAFVKKYCEQTPKGESK